MAKEPKMKIGIGADTGDFEKGARKVKQEMKDLDKVSSDAFAAIGSAIGIDTRQLQQFSSALSGLGRKLTETGSEGSSAFSKIGSAVTSVGAGIAGLGLAAAIAAFKQLNAEADAFEKTIQGGSIARQTEAFTSTFRQALRDQSGAGEDAASWRQDLKEIWAVFMGGIRTGFNIERMQEATKLAGRAKEIASELYDIELQRKENSVKIAEIDAQIAKQREIIYDATRSAEERAAALAAAQQLIKDKLALQLPLAENERNLLEEYNSLASTTIKEYDAEIAAKINVNNLIQQEAAEQRTLLRQQNQINKLLKEEQEIREHWATSTANAIQGIGSGPVLDTTVQVPVEIIVKKESVEEVKQTILDLSSAVTNMATEVGESIGNLFADLARGEDGWSSFANSAISAFGDMAVTVGKMAISTGVATLGIKAALESLNGYVAIAAGVALVALGTAVKSGLANVAGGNYSANSNVASSASYSSGVDNFQQRDIYVNVQGVLRADGNQLLAVINNTEKKNNITT